MRKACTQIYATFANSAVQHTVSPACPLLSARVCFRLTGLLCHCPLSPLTTVQSSLRLYVSFPSTSVATGERAIEAGFSFVKKKVPDLTTINHKMSYQVEAPSMRGRVQCEGSTWQSCLIRPAPCRISRSNTPAGSLRSPMCLPFPGRHAMGLT